jgi:hypothetical protein
LFFFLYFLRFLFFLPYYPLPLAPLHFLLSTLLHTCAARPLLTIHSPSLPFTAFVVCY